MKLIRLGRRAPAISPGPIRFRDQAKLHNPKLGVTRDLANFGKTKSRVKWGFTCRGKWSEKFEDGFLGG